MSLLPFFKYLSAPPLFFAQTYFILALIISIECFVPTKNFIHSANQNILARQVEEFFVSFDYVLLPVVTFSISIATFAFRSPFAHLFL